MRRPDVRVSILYIAATEALDAPTDTDKLIKEQAYEVDEDNIKVFSTQKAAEITKRKRAKCILYCLKSYMAVFLIFVLIMGVYMYSGMGTAAQNGTLAEREKVDHLQQGYKNLRLGDRRIYYRLMEPEDMATHSILLVHGNNGAGEVFYKLGTMGFLREHGARVVAVDIIGMGKSDPPLHLLDNYEGFFAEVVSLFELEYNLVIVCIENGCEKVLSYYLNHGVYQPDNAFIEGAVLVSPKGDNFAKVIDPAKINIQASTRTVIVVGQKDYVINLQVLTDLALIPRNEIHELPNEKNSFYKTHTSYFHAALQALTEGLEYSYDRDLQNIINNATNNQQQSGYQKIYNQNTNLAYNNQNNGYQNYKHPINGYNQPVAGYNRPINGYNQPVAGYNQPAAGYNQPAAGYNQPGNTNNRFQQFNQQQQQQQGGQTLFDKYKKTSHNNDMVYDPVHRFSNVNG